MSVYCYTTCKILSKNTLNKALEPLFGKDLSECTSIIIEVDQRNCYPFIPILAYQNLLYVTSGYCDVNFEDVRYKIIRRVSPEKVESIEVKLTPKEFRFLSYDEALKLMETGMIKERDENIPAIAADWVPIDPLDFHEEEEELL